MKVSFLFTIIVSGFVVFILISEILNYLRISIPNLIVLVKQFPFQLQTVACNILCNFNILFIHIVFVPTRKFLVINSKQQILCRKKNFPFRRPSQLEPPRKTKKNHTKPNIYAIDHHHRLA